MVLFDPYFGLCQDISSVEKHTVQASSEIFLISQENFIKVANSTNKNAKMNI